MGKNRGDPLMAVWDSARPRSQEPYSHPWLADMLFAFDERLQRRHAVFEYTGNPVCIFRLDIGCSPERLALRDGRGCSAASGSHDCISGTSTCPPVPHNGATIAWARQMQQAIAISLQELACYLSVAARPCRHHGDLRRRALRHQNAERPACPHHGPLRLRGDRPTRTAADGGAPAPAGRKHADFTDRVCAERRCASARHAQCACACRSIFRAGLLDEKFGDAGESELGSRRLHEYLPRCADTLSVLRSFGDICLAVAFVGCIFTLIEAAFVVGFSDKEPARARPQPPVTVLKPLHGAEPDLRDRLAAFCRQDYAGPVQVLCGAQGRPAPAAAAVARNSTAKFPDAAIELVVDHAQSWRQSQDIEPDQHAAARALRHHRAFRQRHRRRARLSARRRGAPGGARVGAVTCLYHGIGGDRSVVAPVGARHQLAISCRRRSPRSA